MVENHEFVMVQLYKIIQYSLEAQNNRDINKMAHSKIHPSLWFFPAGGRLRQRFTWLTIIKKVLTKESKLNREKSQES